MRKAILLTVIAQFCLVTAAFPQAASNLPFATWSIHTPEVGVAQREVYVLGVLTPTKPIVVRRIEVVTDRGPVEISRNTWEPVPCPVKYLLYFTNGAVEQTLPLSSAFLSKKSSQTYTDSGPISPRFSAENRITASLILPKQQFPPANCALSGLNITVQYELGEGAADKQDTTQVMGH
jgi:hypothetical protein